MRLFCLGLRRQRSVGRLQLLLVLLLMLPLIELLPLLRGLRLLLLQRRLRSALNPKGGPALCGHPCHHVESHVL